MNSVTDSNGSRNTRFDRAIGALVGLPDVLSTKALTILEATPMVGGAQTFIVQMFRQSELAPQEPGRGKPRRENAETVFLQYIDEGGSTRIVLPPKVVETILRQHESLAGRSRRNTARAQAADRKARGIVPGFLKKRKAAAVV